MSEAKGQKQVQRVSLVTCFADLPDPRVVGRTENDLLDIVVLALCAVMLRPSLPCQTIDPAGTPLIIPIASAIAAVQSNEVYPPPCHLAFLQLFRCGG